MEFVKKHFVALVAVIIAIVALCSVNGVVRFGTAAPSGSISRFTAVGSQYGYYVGTYGSETQVIDDALGAAFAILTTSGLFTENAGVVFSSTNATSTTLATQTLKASDIGNYDTVLVGTVNVSGTTFTFPATSTVTATVPSAGDMQRQCWYNATSSSATLTFAAGAGWDFEVASSTATGAAGNTPGLTISNGNSGCFTYIRKANTDIIAQFIPFVDGD